MAETRSQRGSLGAFWSLVYSDLAIIAAFLLASIWGAGNTVMPIAAGGARGTDFQETTVALVAYSAAPRGILSFALIFWGLRTAPGPLKER
jgi:(hydroxyamino)benzene mutase